MRLESPTKNQISQPATRDGYNSDTMYKSKDGRSSAPKNLYQKTEEDNPYLKARTTIKKYKDVLQEVQIIQRDFDLQSELSNTSTAGNDPLKGLIYGVLTATSAAFGHISVRIAMIYTDINPFEFVYMRSFVAVVIISVMLLIYKISVFKIDKGISLYVFFRVLGNLIGYICQVLSLKFISVSKSNIIVNNPFLTSIIAFLLIKEQVTVHDIICIVLSTSGVIALSNPFSESSKSIYEVVGILFAIISMASYNCSYVVIRMIRHNNFSSATIVFYMMLLNSLCMPSIFVTYEELNNEFTHYTPIVWVCILASAIGSLCSIFFANLTIKFEKAAIGSAYFNFELIYSFLFDVYYVGLSFKLLDFIGGALILVGNTYIFVLKGIRQHLKSRRKQ